MSGEGGRPLPPPSPTTSFGQGLRQRLALVRDRGFPGGGGPPDGLMLSIARASVAAIPSLCRAAPAIPAAGFVAFLIAGLVAGTVHSRIDDLVARTYGLDQSAVRAEPGTAALIAFLTLLSILAAAWGQAVIARAAMLAPLGAKAEWRAVLPPDGILPRLLASLLLPQLAMIALAAAAFVLLAVINHILGGASAWCAAPLLVAPALAGIAACLRASLAAPPAALGLPEIAAESWAITRTRLFTMAGTLVIGVGPFGLLMLLWPATLHPTGFSAAQAVFTALIAVPAACVEGGILARLYQRWRAPLRPDMRPSRHPHHRREPRLGSPLET